MKYKCKSCQNLFDSDDEHAYCRICGWEDLEEIPFNDDKYILPLPKEDHHIWPKFMGNPDGKGQQFPLEVETHQILHSNIMSWIWECVKEEDHQKTIDYIISKSKEFIGVGDGGRKQ